MKYTSVIIIIVISLSSLSSYGQIGDIITKYYTVDASASALNIKFNRNLYDKNLAPGFQTGISTHFRLNEAFESSINISFTQGGVSYLRFYPTATKDTVNIYNTFQVYRQKTRLSFINLKAGIRKRIYYSRSFQIFAGLNLYSGFLISARYKGKELQGPNNYNNSVSDSYRKLNWGVEPEIRLKVNTTNDSFFFITVSNQIGLSDLRKNYLNEQERLWSIHVSLGIPIKSN